MSKKRVTSRLAKKKKKELTKQSLVLILLSIVVILIFIFIVLPNAVQMLFNLLDKGTNLTPIDNIPPQPPTISAPPEATHSAKLSLTGFGEAESKVYLVVNNQEQDLTMVNDNGQFSVVVELIEGENTIKLYSVDAAGNESINKSYQIIKDTQKPNIKIGYPEDGASYELKEEQVVNIQGETEPRARVYINENLTYSNTQGLFNYRYRLDEGENKIKIRVVDLAGNEAEHELIVKYRD